MVSHFKHLDISAMRAPEESLHLLAELNCALCGVTIPHDEGLPFNLNKQEVKIQDWAREAIFCCDMAKSGEREQVFGARGDLGRAGFVAHPLRLKNRDGKPRTAAACLRRGFCMGCHTDRAMFYAHACCWKIAAQFGAVLTPTRLYRFARMTRPMTAWAQWVGAAPRPAMVMPPLSLLKPTSLGQLLQGIGDRLPHELQAEVLELLRDSFVFSLLSTLQARPALELAAGSAVNTSPNSLSERQVWDSPLDNCPTALCAETVHLFGWTYLRRLQGVTPEDAANHTFNIPISQNRGVRGVQYVLGKHGICAVRVVYDDNKNSNDDEASAPWLGNPNRGWYATVLGRDLGTLFCAHDGVRDLRLFFAGDQSPPPRCPDRALWGKASALPAKPRHPCRIIDTGRMHPSVFGHPGSRLVQQVSLTRPWAGDVPLSITVYWDAAGTAGIATDGDPRTLVGSRIGVPKTLQLARGEKIASIHLCTCHSRAGPLPATKVFGPFLLLGTSSGRFTFFGPDNRAFHPKSRWSVLAKKGAGAISGVVVDALALHAISNSFESIGASVDSSVSVPEAPWPPERYDAGLLLPYLVPAPPDEPTTNGCFTYASLAAVDRLRVRTFRSNQRDEPRRCAGLCIDRPEGSIDVLGPWDPLDAAPGHTIYDRRRDGPLESITFVLAQAGSHTLFVTDIRVNDEAGIGDDGNSNNNNPNNDDGDDDDDIEFNLLKRHYTGIELDEGHIGWWSTLHMDQIHHVELVERQIDLSRSAYSASDLLVG